MKMQSVKLITFALFVFGFASVNNINAQNRPYSVSDNTVRTLLVRIQTRTETFRTAVERAVRRDSTGSSDNITASITSFQEDTNRLQQSFDARRNATRDVREVLDDAAAIDAYVQSNRLNPAAQRVGKFAYGFIDACELF